MMKHLLSLMLYVLSTSLAAAEHDDFARLFSHASERNDLDKLRQKQQLKATQALPVLTVLQQPVSLHGYVKRNDGKKSTLWINNQAVQEESTLGNVHVGRLNQRRLTSGASLMSEGVDVSLSANAQTIRLQAGQRYTQATNQIQALPGKENSKSLDLADTDAIITHEKKSTQ
jgi:hypothetical protein